VLVLDLTPKKDDRSGRFFSMPDRVVPVGVDFDKEIDSVVVAEIRKTMMEELMDELETNPLVIPHWKNGKDMIAWLKQVDAVRSNFVLTDAEGVGSREPVSLGRVGSTREMALEGELNRVKSQNKALMGQLQVLNRNLNALLARVQQLSSAPGGSATDASTNLVTNVAGSLVTNAASATPAGAGSGAGSLSSASSVLPSLGDEEVNAEKEKREKPQVVIKAWSALVQDLVAPPAHVSEMRIVSNAPQADSVRIDVQAAKIASLLKPRQDGDKGAVLTQSSGGYSSREFSQLGFEVWLNKNTTIPSVISVGALLRALIPDADKVFDYSRFVLNPNVKAAMMRRYYWIAATFPLCKALPVADNMNLIVGKGGD
jgi:hypothetical protein